ncbi:recombinase family protein [Agrobacterium sp. rho-8.1]|nr:recombinase family protein [Agrobacterium sp. rho-8.1]
MLTVVVKGLGMKAYSYIRISSEKQITGDGIRRQVEASRAYARENGLILDEELSDIGLSGYHGKHMSGGALGGFVALVNEGKIDKGSVLIVESLDRLSREDPFTAQYQLMGILAAEIDVVTLIDRQRYSRTGNHSQMFSALGIVNRAHDESKTKAERTKANIAKRRADAQAGIKTFVINGPSWISQNRQPDGCYTFTFNEHAETLRDIWNWYDEGTGVQSIAVRLNQQKRQVLMERGKSKVWRHTTIAYLLRNEAARGTYAIGNDFRVPDYFPRLVSDEQWFRVQDRISEGSKRAAGRRGDEFTNLFQGLLSCHECGASVRVLRAGKNGKFRYCTCVKRLLKVTRCSPSLLRLDQIETAILRHVTLFHVDPTLGKPDKGKVVLDLDVAIAERERLTQQMKNIRQSIPMIDSEDDRRELMQDLNELRKRSDRQNHQVVTLEKQLREIEQSSKDVADINKEIVTEISLWENMKPEELFASRAKINKSLSKIISTIRLDFEKKEALVFVGGMTKGWRISVDGTITGEMDWSHLPWSVIQTITKDMIAMSPSQMRDAKAVNDSIEGERLPEELFGKHLTGH